MVCDSLRSRHHALSTSIRLESPQMATWENVGKRGPNATSGIRNEVSRGGT